MRVYRDLEQVSPQEFCRPVLSLGVFDGVHLGHQHLIVSMRAWADEVAGEVVVLTFETHPLAVLDQRPPAMIHPMDHRLLLLEKAGVDAVVVLRFDQRLAELSPEAFVDEILRSRIGTEHLLLGFDSRFGRGAEGTAECVRAMNVGIEVREEGRPLSCDGEVISSTAVRQALLQGELDKVERFLGRPASLYGEVIHGDGRGEGLGFPTANLDLFHSAAPPRGVYCGSVEIDDAAWGCLVNIGRRPTFTGPDAPGEESREYDEQRDRVEVYVHRFGGDLYGRQLQVSLLAKVRDERRFGSSEELVAQIRRDVETLARMIHEA